MNELLPREKIIKDGPNQLSDGELIAIMLGTGTKEENVFELSLRISKDIGLERLMEMDFAELKRIRGIGSAKATKLLACFEIAKRYMIRKNEKETLQLISAKQAYEYVKNDYLLLSYEVVIVVFVDAKCRIIKKSIYENFEVAKALLPFRKIVKQGIDYGAHGIFLFHNHPSGDSTPSDGDIETTFKLKDVLKNVGILLLDHIIVGKNEYFSFNDHKYI